MAIALVAHASVSGLGSASTTTTPAIDTTGATLLVLALTYYNAFARPTVADSKGNTWTRLTEYGDTGGGAGSICITALYYATNPTVGSGHTFSLTTPSPEYAPIAVLAFSGVATVSPFDAQNGSSTTVSATLATGSVPPAGNGGVFVTAFGFDQPDTPAIDSGFTISEAVAYNNTVTFGQSVAYLIQGAGSAVNPTWTRGTAGNSGSAALAAFTPLVAGATLARDLAHSPQWQPMIAQ